MSPQEYAEKFSAQTLNASELQKLQTRLASDNTFAQAYYRAIRFELDLEVMVGARVNLEEHRQHHKLTLHRRTRRVWHLAGLTTAAAAVLFLAVLLQDTGMPRHSVQNQVPKDPKIAAVLVATLFVTAGPVEIYRDGDRLPTNTTFDLQAQDVIGLGNGAQAELRFPDTTLLQLQANAVLAINDGPSRKKLYMRQGQVAANVVPQRSGDALEIETPHAQLKVIGTRFELNVAEGTKLKVNEGRVQFVNLQDASEKIVTAGQRAATAVASVSSSQSIEGLGIDLRFLDRMPDNSAVHFDPAWLIKWKGAAAIHCGYGDFSFKDKHVIEDPAQAPEDIGTHKGYLPVTHDTLVALCNGLDADLWMVFPVIASDVYVNKVMRYLHERMKPELKIYLELGREPWNTVTPDGKWASAKGRARAYPQTPSALYYSIDRAIEVFALARNVLGNDRTLIRTLNINLNAEWWRKHAISWRNALDHCDVLSVFMPLGRNIGKGLTPQQQEDLSDEQIKEEIERIMIQRLSNLLQYQSFQLNLGKKIVAYEVGASLLPDNWPKATRTFTQRVKRLSDDPTIKTLLNRNFLEQWSRQIGDIICVDPLVFELYNK